MPDPALDLSWMGIDPGASPLLTAIGIALFTLLSEDLAAIGGGVLAGTGNMGYPLAMIAVFVGIWGGDMGLYGLGRAAAKGLVHWRWLSRKLEGPVLENSRAWFERRGGAAILLSRMIPSSRLPLYLAAGFVGHRFWRFAAWTALAVGIWTPVIVIGAGLLGREFAEHVADRVGHVGLAALGLVLLVALVARVVAILLDPVKRHAWSIRLARARRSEFWSGWLLYPPVVVAIGLEGIRTRWMRQPFAANPCLPAGGVIDESKSAILARMPHPSVLEWILVAPGEPARRAARLRAHFERAGWTWPLILKPDKGERGAGVKLVRDADAAATYLATEASAVVAQVFHPGPVEVGVFWYRYPDRPRGRILGVTDKRFPEVTGDGVSSMRQLIREHPRYRLQEGVFLARLGAGADRVPSEGEVVRLANAGNHAQGTLFADGSEYVTPALSDAIEAIAASVRGFHIGRFDIRCPSYDALRRGEDLAVIELNGVTAEDTRHYDPRYGIWFKWSSLVHSWRIACRIGHHNIRRGHRVPSCYAVWRYALRVARRRPVAMVAD